MLAFGFDVGLGQILTRAEVEGGGSGGVWAAPFGISRITELFSYVSAIASISWFACVWNGQYFLSSLGTWTDLENFRNFKGIWSRKTNRQKKVFFIMGFWINKITTYYSPSPQTSMWTKNSLKENCLYRKTLAQTQNNNMNFHHLINENQKKSSLLAQHNLKIAF